MISAAYTGHSPPDGSETKRGPTRGIGPEVMEVLRGDAYADLRALAPNRKHKKFLPHWPFADELQASVLLDRRATATLARLIHPIRNAVNAACPALSESLNVVASGHDSQTGPARVQSLLPEQEAGRGDPFLPRVAKPRSRIRSAVVDLPWPGRAPERRRRPRDRYDKLGLRAPPERARAAPCHQRARRQDPGKQVLARLVRRAALPHRSVSPTAT